MWAFNIRRMIMKEQTEALVSANYSVTNRKKWTCLASKPKCNLLQVENYSASLVSLYWRSGYFTLKANEIKRFEGTKMRCRIKERTLKTESFNVF
jgi:hypothetical protein